MSKFDFQKSLVAFNQMYSLPISTQPTLLGSERLKNFKAILLKEVDEADEIIDQLTTLEQGLEAGLFDSKIDHKAMELQVLVGLADLLGDIQVYCASEMVKWGLPLDATLRIIMESNMSKLGADGKPIINDQGKVEKGPNYWKPEPMIQKLLQDLGYGLKLDPDQAAQFLIEKRNLDKKA